MGLVVGFSHLASGYAQFWLASGWGSRSLGETAAWFASWAWTALNAVPTTFLLLLFPDGGATLAPLAARGLVHGAWDHRLRRGLRAGRRAAR
jgi:hypothetical protein